MEKERIGELIRIRRKGRGLTLGEMEKLTGIDNGNLSKIERGLQGLTTDTMSLIAKGLGITISDLLDESHFGDSRSNTESKSRPYSGYSVTDFAELSRIPESVNVAIDCVKTTPRTGSTGASARGWVKDPTTSIVFLSDYLRSLNCKPDDLVAHQVQDATMQPRLFAGDHIVIDTTDTEVTNSGGVFAIIIDTISVSIRRLYYTPAGIMIVCENDNYPQITLSPQDAKKVVIVGRVKVLHSNSGF